MAITKHSVTFRDAYLEAAAISRIETAMLDCFSLEHPLLPDVLYFVNDHQSFTATLEDGVTTVEFLACPVRIGKPEESDQAGTPELKLEVDNLSGGVSRALGLIRGSLEPWVLTNYLYSSDDRSAPAVMPPTVIEVKSVALDGNTATMTASFGDAGNVAIPALTFKRVAYPGLIR